jgi:hypothetical protein
MAFCAAGIFLDGVPDLLAAAAGRPLFCVIGVVPGALFTGIARAIAAGRSSVGAATGC